MPITEAIIGSVAKSASDGLARLLLDGGSDQLKIDDSNARACLLDHLASVDHWSSTISMLNLRSDKRLLDAFVDLTLDIGFLRYRDPETSSEAPRRPRERTSTISELIASRGHAAILGRPGAGKTTSLQRIAQLALRQREEGGDGVPILVMLRDLRDGEGIVSHLLAKLGIRVRVGPVDSPQLRRMWEQRVLHRYLDRVSALLLVDGLDETEPVSRRLVESELSELVLAKGNHRLFLTCRTAEYRLDLRRVQAYTIRPLSEERIRCFATQWLGEERGRLLVEEIQCSPYSGTEVVPLTLAHFCALYERDGSLPSRPVDVYEAIVSLLVEEWDRQRGVRRVSDYADFSPRKKERFLQAVAFELAMAGRKGAFRHEDLRRIYQRIAPAFGLPSEDEEAVVLEVESHTGLIQQTGYRRYEYVHLVVVFASTMTVVQYQIFWLLAGRSRAIRHRTCVREHLVIQEFLSAMHAQRTPNGVTFSIPDFPNEMALIVAYSTTVEDYIEQVLQLVLPLEDQAHGFVMAFIARLSVEGVTVAPSARIGWVLLAFIELLSHIRYRAGGRAAIVQREVLTFFRQNGASTSINMAIDQAYWESTTDGVVAIARPEAEVLSFLKGTASGRGFLLRDAGGFAGLLPPKCRSGATDREYT